MCLIFLLILTLTTSVTLTTTTFGSKYNVSSEANAPKCIITGFENIKNLELTKLNFSHKIDLYQVGKNPQIRNIKCTAPYPIDFEFDGQLPKRRELRVNFINPHQTTGIIIFQIWIHYLQNTDSNPSGKYSIFSVDNSTLRTSLYVFDANNKSPQLFRMSMDDNDLSRKMSNASLIIGCRNSAFDVPVLLFRQSLGLSKTIEQIAPSKMITYDPRIGFTWNLTGQSLEQDDIKNFIYVCQCDQCKNGKNSLEFKFTPAAADNGKEITHRLAIDIKVVNHSIQIICTEITNNTRDLYLANVFARNPRQLSLFMECLPKNQTFECSDSKLTALAFSTTVILESARSSGVAYCLDQKDETVQISKQYFRGTDDVIYYDWNVALKSRDSLLKIQSLNDEKIYSNLSYTFTCTFQSYILFPPSFFQLHYKDGSTETYFYKSEHKDRETERTIEVTFTLFSNISKVSCSSLPWNSSIFVNSSMDFILRDKRPPKFDTNEERMRFLLKSTTTQLQCTADGDELPKINWEKNEMPLNETDLDIKYDPGRSIIIFPLISHEHKGNYNCIANNSVGKTSKIYHIDVENPDKIRTNINYGLVAGLPLGGLAILIITVIASYINFRHFHRKRLYLTQEEIDEFKCGSDGYNNTGESDDQMRLMQNIQYGPYTNKYEIHSSKFQLDRSCILGSGQFGIVYKGLYNHEPIAVKTLKANTEKIYIKALLSELKVMIYINGHKNIVNLVGANTESLHKGEVYIFVELCSQGSLEGFLRRHQLNFVNQIFSDGSIQIIDDNSNNDADILYTKDLILWSLQISSGMEYLACKKVIHGDLATRNILLLNRETLKISDFGLAKRLYDYTTYEKNNVVPMPWRWMAIESLQNLTFSTKTDVWSFGVTLWEIFTLANVPYPGLSWSPDFVKQLQFNMRMPQPDYASDDIYDLMRRCWEIEPNDRPSFTYINAFFSEYMNKFSPSTQYLNLFKDD